jgi:hypothetical protein
MIDKYNHHQQIVKEIVTVRENPSWQQAGVWFSFIGYIKCSQKQQIVQD